MKLARLLPLALLFAVAAPAPAAENIFPGLHSVLTAAEWQRAGLDRLTPDQIGVIDAALIRHLLRPAANPTAAPATKPSLWERFGLTRLPDSDWRTQPPLVAQVTAWQGGNRFVLDNGQVWEGVEPIPFELPGRHVSIEARPMGNFALKLNDQSAPVRVRRVK